jgi:hypothetical protein
MHPMSCIRLAALPRQLDEAVADLLMKPTEKAGESAGEALRRRSALKLEGPNEK